jgi:hypothetical protein
VVARPEVLRWRRSTVSFSWTMMTTEEIVLVGIVVVGSSSKVLLHLQRKTVVQSIHLDGDGGGAVVAEDGSRGGWQWRAERTLREEEGKWERVSSGDAHMWG